MRFNLDGSLKQIDLGGGISLRAPGLQGTGNIDIARAQGTRGPELATELFDDALKLASLDEMRNIQLDVAAVPIPPTAAPIRGPTGEDVLELKVPDLGPKTGQVVLSIDEYGALRWHFPLENDQSIQPAPNRGRGNVKTFRIPRVVASKPSSQDSKDRSLIGAIGRKVLKVLVYPVTDAILGPITDKFVGEWEKKNRPSILRRFDITDRDELSLEDWSRMGTGRALLFVHGTFSTSRAAFSQLPEATHDSLKKRYGDRLFAFDHPSLSVSPDENADWLLSHIPENVSLDLDIVSHSRGGLVARSLAGKSQTKLNVGKLKVNKVVLVGVPNAGTILADPDHMIEMIDRTTTILNLFPIDFVTDVLEGVLSVVKVIGSAGLVHLDGLSAMRPDGPYLSDLRNRQTGSAEFFAVASDFEPTGSGLASFLGQTVADEFMDRVFQNAQNDLIVPTSGVFDLPNVELPQDRQLRIAAEQGISHSAYFSHEQTLQNLLSWLCD